MIKKTMTAADKNDIILKTLTNALLEEDKLGLLLQDLIRRTGINREKLLRELDGKVRAKIIGACQIAGGSKKTVILYYMPFILDLAKEQLSREELKR